jgi:hypothetical protein
MLTGKIKACLNHSIDLLPTNLLTSVLVASAGLVYGLPFWKTFSLMLVTGGAFLASYFYGRRKGQEYYFYYNLGIAKATLYASAFVVDLLLAARVQIEKNNIR